ncbi:hypothetical protein Mal64_11670 [Pseudobythopirellula maris]|uniref:TIGR03545 family protein n=1 Tax=Pseudobythopirellula maris TaxID=2527991 RepID=A0A5C5ZU28_9BACT|nr:TIGR03545 family protein [Pseudobythopirellula maris]TWT90770.1 hypothetical protein Mal64_11670 [Pseudobythopirellula maris]
MSRYLRLGYIVPRLVLLFAVLCLSEPLAAWLVRSAVVRGGEGAIGAKVEIGESRASLFRTSVVLRDLAVADPREPMRNLLEADEVSIDFDADSLLRRKAIAEHASAVGLRFGGVRTESGALDESTEAEAPSWLAEGARRAAAEQADQWLDHLESKITGDLAGQFVSVQLAEELAQRWPERYQSLSSEAAALSDEIKQLRDDVLEARRNPLRHAEYLASVPQRVSEITKRLGELTAEAKQLPTELKSDRQQVAAARRHDEETIRRSLSVDQLDSQSLTTYLLGERVTGPVGDLVDWLRWARRMAPAGGEPAIETPRDRGVDVLFAGVKQRPDLLIRELELAGVARVAGQPLEVTGVVNDFTTQPRLHGVPMSIVLKGSGATPVELHATVDRTGPTPRDELFVDCQGLATPRVTLGAGDRLRIEASPSATVLSVSLTLEGERLSGEVQMIQNNLRLTPHVDLGESLVSSEQVETALAEGLAGSPSVVTRVSLAGTLDQPQLAVWSTLGASVAESLQRSLERVIGQQAERVLAQSRGELDDRMATLERRLGEASSSLDSALAGPREALDELTRGALGGVAGRGSLPFEQLGKQLPDAGMLFR